MRKGLEEVGGSLALGETVLETGRGNAKAELMHSVPGGVL